MRQNPCRPAVACSPRPWLSRLPGECAFPVAGQGLATLSCCNPCGPAPYCPGHAAAMRGPKIPPVADFEREVLRFLEQDR